MKRQLTFFLLFIFFSCGTMKNAYYSDDVLNWESEIPHSGKRVIQSLYLVGDTGELDNEHEKTNIVLEALKEKIALERVETSLVFLGDNIYPKGMPSKKSKNRKYSEDVINAQLDCAKAHDGKTYFIPGNHDWNKHNKGGRKAILRQEKYVESYFKKKKRVKFYPNNACGDPKVIKINKDLVYIFLDTQWWLQNWEQEKKMNQGCEIKSRGDLLKRMQELFVEHKNDEVVVLMHHPIKSDGTHGGNFNVKSHLFPLTELNNKLWIPLPLIGSLYPLYRKLTGSKQDITNVHNQDLMQALEKYAHSISGHVVFISGHDHGLQFFDDKKVQHVVCGAGGKVDYVKRGGEADFARSGRGFARINFHKDFEAWIEFFVIDPITNELRLEFRNQLRAPRAGTVEEEKTYAKVTDKTMRIAANEKFAASPIKKLFFGSQYRNIWTTHVEAEIIDLESKLGGLTPIKKGGGQASNSLRMQKNDGKQYILRSIKKDYTKLVPAGMENLKLIDVLADQNSASHPYNALVIPSLSKAAGIYYTEPKLVYLNHQRGLGNYNSQFSEELYLLEERPNGNWRDAGQFGNSEEIIGYSDLLNILREKKNHFVDQEWVLKSRMFDLFIHDWDRHDDQWRWAKFKEDGKNIYRPIPRDRDQAFYRFKGIVPWFLSQLFLKQFKTIKKDNKDIKYLSFNAKHFDRYFLHQLEWKEWEPIIYKLQENLTDEKIDSALSQFPTETRSINTNIELADILKHRRNNLMKFGKKLYKFLSKEVEITGTDNEDHFLIKRYSDGRVNVSIETRTKGKANVIKYDRTFYPNETKEIRLYGLRGKDEFEVTGADNKKIKIRIIGGEDQDKLFNETKGGQVYAYDEKEGIRLYGKITDKTSNDVNINEYDRNGFQYNTDLPGIIFGNSVDDGWWIGGTYSWEKKGWRKQPYKSSQRFALSAAPGSRGAFHINYRGHFPDAFGKVDFAPDVKFDYPYYENFFGFGNNSRYDLTKTTEYYWVRMKSIDVNPRIKAKFGNHAQLELGPHFQHVNVESTVGRVSEDVNIGFEAEDLESRSFLGGDVKYRLGAVDNSVFPTNGLIINASVSHIREISKNEKVTELGINAQFYFRFVNKPRVVFATQIGYAKSFGDLQFYQYQDLGNNRGLRGFRNERFRGTSVFYHNMDVRIKLLNFDNSILPMDIGVLAGYDYGRVNVSSEMFDDWHTSSTVGLWFDLLGVMLVQPHYSINEEQNTFALQLGFNF